MPGNWPEAVADHLAGRGPVCRVVVAEAKGSAPREAGAWMLVGENGIEGTIGGGSLEYEAMAVARRMAGGAGFRRHWQKFALGPSLGQCCGGSVTLLFEAFGPGAEGVLAGLADAEAWEHGGGDDSPPRPAETVPAPEYDARAKRLVLPAERGGQPFFLYGAGHVGRALMAVTGGLGLDRHWIDDDPGRFPDAAPEDAAIVPAKDMAAIARRAPAGAFHLVMTYSHRLDEEIVPRQGGDRGGGAGPAGLPRRPAGGPGQVAREGGALHRGAGRRLARRGALGRGRRFTGRRKTTTLAAP